MRGSRFGTSWEVNSYQTAVSDLISENVEALARDETSSGFAEVSCYYEEVTDSNGDVVQSHAIMCEGEGDKACTCSHEK